MASHGSASSHPSGSAASGSTVGNTAGALNRSPLASRPHASHASHASHDSTSSFSSNTTSIAAPELDVDPSYESDNDSAIANDPERTTASLSSSTMSFKEINGRTYQSFSDNSDYWGPNDDKQNEGLNLTHNMLQVLMDGRLFNAPISENPENVIDVGTGTGVWAIEFADQYPQSNVIGTDLSPIQPSWVPPNLRFELDDAQKPWAYPDNYFDFVHVRVLLGSIRDWPALYAQIFRVLKPGGYFEHFEFSYEPKSDDGSVKSESGWSQYSAALRDAGERMGQTFNIIDNSRNVGWFNDAGFEDVTEIRYKVPVGGWPADAKYKMIGYLNYVVNDTDLDGYGAYFFTKVNNWSPEKIESMVDKCRQELHDRAVHVYFDGATVYGRKPFPDGNSSSASTIRGDKV